MRHPSILGMFSGLLASDKLRVFIDQIRSYGLVAAFREAWKAVSARMYSGDEEEAFFEPELVEGERTESPRVKNITISVVIPTKNAGDSFRQLLAAIAGQKGFRKIEVITVDSGSTDQTLTLCREFGTRIIEIPPEAFSHSYARNVGAEQASGDFLFFTVQDALLPSELFFYDFHNVLQKNNVVAISCAELPREDADLFYKAGCWYHYKFLGVLGRNRIMSKPGRANFITLRKNGSLSDIACFISRETFLKYKYRTDFAEDLDLGLRLVRDDYRLAFLSSVKIIHSHNRPAYYYLRRGYVDQLGLSGLFPDSPILALRTEELSADILTGFEVVNSVVNRLHAEIEVPCDIDKFSDIAAGMFATALRHPVRAEQPLRDGVVDREFPEFIQRVSGIRHAGRLHRPSVIAADTYGVFRKVIIEYLKGVTDSICAGELEEIGRCLFKSLAMSTGVHLAKSSVIYPVDTSALLKALGVDLRAAV